MLEDGNCCSQVPCTMPVTYGDNSGFQGNWVEDYWFIGSKHNASVPFVSINITQTGSSSYFEEPPAAGIVGLAYDVLNSVQDPTLADLYSCADLSCNATVPSAVTKWLELNKLPNIITLCYNSPNDLGTATFGGVPSGVVVSYAAIIETSYYVVNVTELKFGSFAYHDNSNLNANSAILDTGTSASLNLPQNVYNSVCNSSTPPACSTDDDCIMTVVLEGYNGGAPVSVSIPSAASCLSSTCVCNETVAASNQLMIAYQVLSTYTLVLDRENNRVGFAISECQPSCDLFVSALTCQSTTYCVWQGGLCTSTPTTTTTVTTTTTSTVSTSTTKATTTTTTTKATTTTTEATTTKATTTTTTTKATITTTTTTRTTEATTTSTKATTTTTTTTKPITTTHTTTTSAITTESQSFTSTTTTTSNQRSPSTIRNTVIKIALPIVIVVVVLIICTVVFLLYKHRHNNSHINASRQQPRTTSNANTNVDAEKAMPTTQERWTIDNPLYKMAPGQTLQGGTNVKNHGRSRSADNELLVQ